MSKLKYIYAFKGKDFNDKLKFPGEKLLCENNNIKLTDSDENRRINVNVFYTNYRILCLTGEEAVDIPYQFIINHFTKTPIFKGKKYIQLELLREPEIEDFPIYIRINFSKKKTKSAKLFYPQFIHIKFGNKNDNMEESYEVIKKAIKDKEYQIPLPTGKENIIKCKYTKEEINNILSNFVKYLRIQDYFFRENDEEYSLKLLKRKEKKDLTDYFNSNISDFLNQVEKKAKYLINSDYDFKNISRIILSEEKAEISIGNKIKQELKKINEDSKRFEIQYLTIMVMGKSGVGKSTLINNVLKLEGNKKANARVGKFTTTETASYQSRIVPFLRLIDTRGIELDENFGVKAIKNNAKKFINEQLKTANVNNFVHCIWYCITGNRFEPIEINLINSLKSSYGDNSIPIIIVYTQATRKKTINEMKDYISKQNIGAKFIEVLAEREESVNNTWTESFGLDKLVEETLNKIKKALNGEMRAVMVNNITNNINNVLQDENNKIYQYIHEKSVLDFIQFYKIKKSQKDFMKHIIDLIGNNVSCFLDNKISQESLNLLSNAEVFKTNITEYINFYKALTNKTIKNDISRMAIDFLIIKSLYKNQKMKIY